MTKARLLAGMAAASFALLSAGCQSGGILGGGRQAAPDEKVKLSELLGYCPKVSVREGTSALTSYAKGGDGDKAKVTYQASITAVTRSCSRESGQLNMNVGVAGRIVPGPLGQAGSITLPIRVVVLRGEEVLYSKLSPFPVSLASTESATQFVFTDPAVSVPDPTEANLKIIAGFDEGPQKKTTKADALSE